MKKVLIVDDNVSFTEFLDATIRAAGHETRVVHNGAEAVEIWEDVRPDLVFLDVLLPKKDGFKVCKEIRARDNGGGPTPVVLMTGIYTKQTYKRDAVTTYGATEYLVKPFTITDVWRCLEKYLGGRVRSESPRPVAAEAIPDDGREAFGGVSLRDKPLALILSELRREQRTGLLFLKGEDVTDVFFMDGGELAFVRSNDVEQRLDKVLERSGRLTSDQVAEARKLLVESRGQARMGEILVSLGHLDRAALEEAVQAQLRSRIHAAFRNQDLGFTFVEGPLPMEEDIRVHLDGDDLLLEGMREMTDSTALVGHLPAADVTLRAGRRPPESLRLTAYERQVLDLVNGRNTVEQILAIGRLAQVDVARTLFALLCLDLAEVGGAAAADDAAGPAPGGAEDDAEARTAPLSLPVRGDLRLLPPARVLAALHAAGRTGVLELRFEDRRKWIYLDRGEMVFAGSDDPRDRLGEVLVEGGVLTQEQRERIVEIRSRQDAKRLGQILVEEGVLDLEELQWAVVFQVQRIITSCLAWTEGRYRFREESLPTQEAITVDLRTADLLLEGLRRIAPVTAARALPGPDMELKPASGSGDRIPDLRLTAQELDVWRALGEGAARAELEQRRTAPAPTLSVVLHMFLALGLLADPRAVKTAPARASEEAARRSEGGDLLDDLAMEVEAVVEEHSSTGQPPPPRRRTRVPRFLYDQLLRERHGLEQALFETRERLLRARGTVIELERALKHLRGGLRADGAALATDRIEPLLEELASLCERSAEDLAAPELESPAAKG